MKLPHLIVHECTSEQTRVMRLNFKDPDNYADVGKFVLNSLAKIVPECAKQDIKPCIHIVPRQLSKEEFDKIDRADWHLEAKGLISAVERGDKG